MSLADNIQRDGVRVFVKTTEFAEPVIFTPSGSAPRTIPAQVFRKSPTPIQSSGQAKPLPYLRVWMAFDSTGVNGLTAPPDRGGVDTVTVAEVDGGDAKIFPITEIVSSDPGGCLVKLR